MTHLSDERLLETYYGDAEISERRHLDQCGECRGRFDELREMLEAWRAYPVPERAEGYESKTWERVAKRLTGSPARRWRGAWFWAPALAALLAVAFWAGIWTEREHPSETATARMRERVLLMAMSDHLERSQVVLTELLHSDAQTVDLPHERDRARALLDENRLLRQSAVQLRDLPHAALLDDLERVFLALANSSNETGVADVKLLQKRMEKNSLLWKVRISSSNAREKGQRL